MKPDKTTPTKTYPTASTSLILDEDDIPEDEMHYYIRSPEEIEMHTRIQRQLEESGIKSEIWEEV